jgi:ribosome-associated translation inhibitor RaiA
MRVVIESLEDRGLRTLVAGKITATLSRLRVGATTARVQFSDENGPKGGPDTKCSITVEVPRRAELHADTVADNPRLAFEQAFAALERQIERERERVREERRRPKKYYLAKRLLEPGASALEPPRRRPRLRAARRRTA